MIKQIVMLKLTIFSLVFISSVLGNLRQPNGPSQVACYKKALRNAGLRSNDITMVETHGTGTGLGDP